MIDGAVWVYGAGVMKRVYVETSVVSYYCARPSRDLVVAAHQQITRDWWESCLDSVYEPVISDEVLDEISQGDAEAVAKRQAAVAKMRLLPATEDVRKAARLFATALKLPVGAFSDALHIAYAVVFACDYLATWNCKHIAGAEAQELIESVCVENALPMPRFCTPEQLMEVCDEG